ncbi:MAG: ATPase [Deltaproteobacteria bacterium]|nr:MAG: ATPase [Deltaproteobacteria bacterium]
MIIRMAKVELVGPKDDLMGVLDLLRERGTFQPDPLLFGREASVEADLPRTLVLGPEEMHERVFFVELRARVAELLALLPDVPEPQAALQPLPVVDVLHELVDRHLALARSQAEELRGLREEVAALAGALNFWTALAPLWEELPPESNLELFGVTIRDPQQRTVLEEVLREHLGGRCQLSSTLAEDGTLVGLIACERAMAAPLRAALTSERVPELPLPAAVAGLPLAQRISALRALLAERRAALAAGEETLAALGREWRPVYRRALEWLDERLTLYGATSAVYATTRCFVLQGWLAAGEAAPLRERLHQAFAGRVLLEELAILDEELERVPVQLRNPAYFQPFEIFSRLLPLPRYTSFDPTPFIGVFFPVLFGMMLGDVGYGAVLFAIAAPLARRGRGLAGDLGKVLGVAAVYAMFFGVLFGELFGDLGRRWLDLHPWWVERTEAIVPTMLFATSVGVAHVLFGLLLGVWSDWRQHRGREALLRLGLLLVVLLLALVGLGRIFPTPWLATGPLLVGVAVLLPVLSAAGGLLAPLELLKTLGNIISYVRIMAIGLSSALLAVVANQLGGEVGNLLLGILVAGILHAFNLLLGVFAPTVHALRLHYVEFFSKFLDLGGRRFEPFGRAPRSPHEGRQ